MSAIRNRNKMGRGRAKTAGGPGFRRLSMVPKGSSHFQPEPGPVLSPPHSFVPASPQAWRFFPPRFVPGHQSPRDSEPPHPQPCLLPSLRLLPRLGLKTPLLQPGVPRWHRRVSCSALEPAPSPGKGRGSAWLSSAGRWVGTSTQPPLNAQPGPSLLAWPLQPGRALPRAGGVFNGPD